MGADVVGRDVTHHFEKSAAVIRLSYALLTGSLTALQAVPVPEAVPPSVRSTGAESQQTLAVPPPPQVCGARQAPHELTVRETPQLSLAVTASQFLPRRAQKAASVSA